MTRLVILAVLAAVTVLALIVFDRIDDTDVQVITERHEAADVTIPIHHDEQPPPTTPPGTATTTIVEAKARTAPTAVVEHPTSTSYDIAALEQIIRNGFARFGPAVAEEAVDQAWCETAGTLDPNSTGAEGEVGLLQIHPRYHTARAAKFGWTMHDLYDPARNVTVAADIYTESGWSPWTCQP